MLYINFADAVYVAPANAESKDKQTCKYLCYTA